MSPSRSIPTRRISFEPSLHELPRHFAGDGDLIMSHVLVSLSSVFPDGEDYFVRSVRHYRDQITDPELRRQVSGFIGQESMHGREHRQLNDRFDELGYWAKRFERLTRKALTLRERVLTPRSNLAATAALEHFTATLAEKLLTDREARRRIGDPEVQKLLLWHALEESEHKAVAFDVYRAVGGSEWLRIATMRMLMVGFIGGMSLQAIFSLLTDPTTYRSSELRRSLGRLRTSPFLTLEVWNRLADYNRRGFHPDDHDNTAIIDEWRAALFGDEGALNDKLAGTAA
jgi:predicted metal-dependent hydrolase